MRANRLSDGNFRTNWFQLFNIMNWELNGQTQEEITTDWTYVRKKQMEIKNKFQRVLACQKQLNQIVIELLTSLTNSTYFLRVSSKTIKSSQEMRPFDNALKCKNTHNWMCVSYLLADMNKQCSPVFLRHVRIDSKR